MAVPSLAELIKEKSKEELFDEYISAISTEGIPTTAWQEGEPIRVVFSVVAKVASKLWNTYAVPALRAPFLDYAAGVWLTLLALGQYNILRQQKTFAAGNVLLVNTGLSLKIVPVGGIVIRNAVTKKTYRNTTSGSIAAWAGVGNPFPSSSFGFIADEAGSAGNVLPGELAVELVSGDPQIQVNPAVTLIGSDEETDERLRERCRDSVAALSVAAPASAYKHFAKTAKRPDGSDVGVTRVRVVDLGNAAAHVYLAGDSGGTTGTSASAGTDVFYVYQNLLPRIPFGTTLQVSGAVGLPVNIVMHLIVDLDSGVTANEAIADATAAILNHVKSVPIGGHRAEAPVAFSDPGWMYASEVIAKASESNRGIVKVNSFLGDTSIPYNKVPTVAALLITAELVKQS